jgi:hypothetical protein
VAQRSFPVEIAAFLPLCIVVGPSGAAARPSIRVTRIPPYGAGPDKMDTIAGQASGVDFQKHKVVIFAGTDEWYVQPYIGGSDTSIDPGGKWESDTHLGFRYAALLVKTSYKPPAKMGALPSVGGEVLAIHEVQGRR